MKLLFYCIFFVFFSLFSYCQTVQSLIDSCIKYYENGDYHTSIQWGEKGLSFFEQHSIQKDTNYSNLLGRQAESYYYLGMHENALQYALQDSIWASQHHDPKRYSTACSNLGIIYKAQGRYYDAERLFYKTLQITAQNTGTHSLEYATDCNNLASLYQEMGRYGEAEILYRKSKEIRLKHLGKLHPDYATVCNNMAVMYKNMGLYENAKTLFEEATAIDAQYYGTENIHHAVDCNNLASVYHDLKDYPKSKELYIKAKNLYAKLLGENHSYYIYTCNNLALIYMKEKKYTEAESILTTILKKMKSKNIPYTVICTHLANLYTDIKRYSAAESLYNEAIAVQEQLLGKKHPQYIKTLYNKALFYKVQQKFDYAESLYVYGIHVKMNEIENVFNYLSETEKEKYMEANIYEYFNDFQNFVYTHVPQKPSLAELSYNLTLQTKGLILQNNRNLRTFTSDLKSPELLSIYKEWKQSKELYARCYTLSKKQLKEKHIDTDSLIRHINNLEKELTVRNQNFATMYGNHSVSWKDIQKALKKDEACIEIVRVGQNNNKDSAFYMALVVKKDSKYPEIIKLPDENMLEKEYAINYKRSTKYKIYDPYSYNTFWKPLKNAVKNISTVYFSADGIYHQINVNTLQNPETKKYVLDEIQIINVTNSKDILDANVFASKNNYLIGNPKFNLELDTKNNEKSTEQRTIESLSQLDGAEKEVKQIATILPNAKTTIGAEATEEYVKAIKNPRILHIATHGYFKKGQYQSSTQAMLNAGLLFAGVVDYDRMEIRPFDKEDGKLTAFEVMNMELDSTELVVLSACETGLGQASKEGVYGLQRAFKVAGTQTIIMSLWKVSDEATQLLMTKFYENWQKKSMNKRIAFQTAQKELRKIYKEPYYWGAFVMIE